LHWSSPPRSHSRAYPPSLTLFRAPCSFNIVSKALPISDTELRARFAALPAKRTAGFVARVLAMFGADASAASAPAAQRLGMGLPEDEASKLINVLIDWMLGLPAAQRPVAMALLE
jgi:hypothetical protein